MIHIYTGDGKGKTTAAIGLLIRAFGSGKRVSAVFFDKGSETYKHSELAVFDRLGIAYKVTGLERMKPDGTFRFGASQGDIAEAQKGVEAAKSIMAENRVELLVLDEVLSAYSCGLLQKSDLKDIIKACPKSIELVLTGRCSDEEIFEEADLVTLMQKKKHYFDKGAKARAGIEY